MERVSAWSSEGRCCCYPLVEAAMSRWLGSRDGFGRVRGAYVSAMWLVVPLSLCAAP